ncbi:MAG: hypothetical protein Q7K43_03895 [Candidatus Woesearchaeota archaeon]|nr:hypothetical protein [Candidatus Woesearchaeota archaeon]
MTSTLDATLRVLQKTNTPFDLEVVGEVAGRGLNDTDFPGTYLLQRLQYGNTVIREQMERTCDCDCDDTLFSTEVSLIDGEEPENLLPLEVFACVCGYNCYNLNEKENANAFR